MRKKLDEHDFWRQVRKGESCWVWTGPRTSDGRPNGTLDGVRECARRIAWRLVVDPHLSDDIVVRRTCRHVLCVNPAHMRAAPHSRVQAAEWAELHRAGWTHKRIAQHSGRTRETVTRALRDYEHG